MTQLSSNTILYDKIIYKILDFVSKYRNNERFDVQDVASEYHQILSEISDSYASPMLKVEQFVKGEPPSSDKINSFIRTMRDDIEIISRQMDFMSAKTISMFNLFSEQVKAEKFNTERIASKTKVLQMYLNSPAEDIVYLGDSFENYDLVDVSRINPATYPNIDNGSFTLPVTSLEYWAPGSLSLIDINGIVGDNHRVIRSENEENEEFYEYKFLNSASVSNPNAMLDGNPATYFEVEKIRVDDSDLGNGEPVEIEFNYLDTDDRSQPNNSSSTFLRWNNSDRLPLQVTLSMSTRRASLANCIKIYPHFSNSLRVKVSSVKLFDAEENSYNVLDSPIFIGSNPVSYTVEEAPYYFHNYATVRFDELMLQRVEIVFEQDSHEDVLIHHQYWKPVYDLGAQPDGPFVNQARFNPDAIDGEVEYNLNSVVPSVARPNSFKTFKRTINLPVSVRTVDPSEVFYLVSIAAIDDGEDAVPLYFMDPSVSVVGDVTFSDIQVLSALGGENAPAPLRLTADADAETLLRFKERSYAESFIENVIDSLSNFFGEENYTITLGEKTYDMQLESLSVETLEVSGSEKRERFVVPLKNEFELREAERLSIGISGIEVCREIYANEAEIVSKSFQYARNVLGSMLSVTHSMPVGYSGFIQAFISPDEGGSWVEISPAEFAFQQVPEVLAFNQNVLDQFKIAGVSYLNSPDVPAKIDSLRVRLRIVKSPSVNHTPVIYSYKLMARVDPLS